MESETQQLLTEGQGVVSETKAALTVQISRLFSELTNLRSQIVKDKGDGQMTISKLMLQSKSDQELLGNFVRNNIHLVLRRNAYVKTHCTNITGYCNRVTELALNGIKFDTSIRDLKICLSNAMYLFCGRKENNERLVRDYKVIDLESNLKAKEREAFFSDLIKFINQKNKTIRELENMLFCMTINHFQLSKDLHEYRAKTHFYEDLLGRADARDLQLVHDFSLLQRMHGVDFYFKFNL
jgi:hypothetical protein